MAAVSVPLLFEWLGAVSLIVFIASLLVVPWLIGRLPADYFIRHRAMVQARGRRHPVLLGIAVVLRNAFGGFFLLAGIAMLVLPGQGILTMLLGFSLMDLPGKHRLLDWLTGMNRVQQILNWVRRKEKKPPFLF